MYIDGNPPRVPMSVNLSVKESGELLEQVGKLGIKATYDGNARVSVLSLERFFGGHSIIETAIVQDTAPMSAWQESFKVLDQHVSQRVRQMQPIVTPDIAALLNVADCDANYEAMHDAWFLRWRAAPSSFHKYRRQIPTNADYETWRAALTSITDELAAVNASTVDREAPEDAQQAPVLAAPPPAPVPSTAVFAARNASAIPPAPAGTNEQLEASGLDQFLEVPPPAPAVQPVEIQPFVPGQEPPPPSPSGKPVKLSRKK